MYKNPEAKRVYNAAWYRNNLEKVAARRRAYQAANAEKIKLAHRAWRAANVEKIKKYRAERLRTKTARERVEKYGVSPEAFQLMRLRQRNACGICKETFLQEPNVDHCHATGEVRGLLCGRCNRGLGLFKDSPEILENAKEYLAN